MLPFILAAVALLLSWIVIMPIRFHFMKGDDDTPFTFVLKGLPTAMAAALACYAALTQNPGAYANWMALGLIICLLADVVLGIQFAAGGGLFLCGHICYVIALTSLVPLTLWHGVIFAIAMAVLQGFLLTYRKRMTDKLIAYGVCVYAAALSALLAAALPLPYLAEGFQPVLAAVGAVLFVLSDATLCDNMINNRPLPNQYISLGIYYTAQFLLGLSTLPVL